MTRFFAKSADLTDLFPFIGQHTGAWGEQWQNNVLAPVSFVMGNVDFVSALEAYKKQISRLGGDGTTTEFSGKLLEAIKFVDSMKALEQSQRRPAKRRSPLGHFTQGVAQNKAASGDSLFGAGYVTNVGVFGGGHCQPIGPSSCSSGSPLAKRAKNP